MSSSRRYCRRERRSSPSRRARSPAASARPSWSARRSSGSHDVEFHRIGIPDEYVHHGSQDVLRAQYDLHAAGIAERTKSFVRQVAGVPKVAS
jgi:hypothetical protein